MLSQRVERRVEGEALLDDGDEHIHGHGDPDLQLHGVLGRAVEPLDTKMLLDSLEKRFHLPTALVERADGERWQGGLIGQEHQRLAGVGIFEADATQMIGVVASGVIAIEGDGLIADDARGPIRRCRRDTVGVQVRLGAGDEEAACSVPSEMWMTLGIAPRRSSRVCIFTAALVERNGAHANSDRHRSMVVESRA